MHERLELAAGAGAGAGEAGRELPFAGRALQLAPALLALIMTLQLSISIELESARFRKSRMVKTNDSCLRNLLTPAVKSDQKQSQCVLGSDEYSTRVIVYDE